MDLFKRGLFSMLPHQVRSRIVVIPMCSDLAQWTTEDKDTYQRLLGIEDEGRIAWESGSANPRLKGGKEPFAKLEGAPDIFLDPDTGIACGDKGTYKHLTVDDIRKLLDLYPSSVLLIYQHDNRMDDSFILDKLSEFSCFEYIGTSASIFFVARSEEHLTRYKEPLSRALGTAAKRRLMT